MKKRQAFLEEKGERVSLIFSMKWNEIERWMTATLCIFVPVYIFILFIASYKVFSVQRSASLQDSVHLGNIEYAVWGEKSNHLDIHIITLLYKAKAKRVLVSYFMFRVSCVTSSCKKSSCSYTPNSTPFAFYSLLYLVAFVTWSNDTNVDSRPYVLHKVCCMYIVQRSQYALICRKMDHTISRYPTSN